MRGRIPCECLRGGSTLMNFCHTSRFRFAADFIRAFVANGVRVFAFVLALMAFGVAARAQAPDVSKKLEGFDAYMEQTLKDWNTPAAGVGIVVNDKLVFAKGYGYRDYEKKLPFTTKTLEPIASNTKLFTAVAARFLVEEGKVGWGKTIRDAVSSIWFFQHELYYSVSLRGILG